MTATLEDRIREVFEADAGRAPFPDAAWRGPTIGITSSSRPRRWPALVWLAVAAAVVAVVGTGYVVTRPDDSAPAAWQPKGVEYPLTDLGPATSSSFVTVAALSRAIQVPGQPVINVVRTVEYNNGASAEEWRCEDMRGSAGCAPDWTWATNQPDISISSSVDNHVADQNVWMWGGLPDGTAFVEYADGDQHWWQRPVAGLAVFPDVEGSSEVVTAFAENGSVLGRVGAGAESAQSTARVPPRADVDAAQSAELQDLTNSTLRDCLMSSGATWSSPDVAGFVEGIDQRAVWESCVAQTKSVVAARITALGVRLYDPVTERPQSTDSPVQTSDTADCHPVSTNPEITECAATTP